ncbi:hypothetical protein SAMN05216464_103268 [Mucilaginibacter pineti]|uniref:Uncharacterized protein n=1 Tax=Mucilaginibacter pineti TaxID=1391627 RepID=A0A1G6ZC13_9SPHI|nr:hypothetical protein [Mucilaginibacter pineti]SDD99256.1 hypothetical protein SAMN05216464_103268 [Mucilaginibacter pineti]
MKKSELKSKVKAETKKIEKEIETGLISELKTVTTKLGKGTTKLAKKIGKGSKKLAKKIAKEVKPVQPAKPEKIETAVAKPEKAKPVRKAKIVSETSPEKIKKNKDAAQS